ncbi:hypothetical protein Tco_0134833 [Tanacetum coccineum]
MGRARGRAYVIGGGILYSVPIVPADPIVALEHGQFSVRILRVVLDLVDYSSSSDSDPSEDSLPPAPRVAIRLIRPGKAIPFGRLYRTHPNGLCKLLTARKRVEPIPADHSLSGHTPPDTINADSSTLHIFVHRSPSRTSRRKVSAVFRHVNGSSSPSSRPSRKRCRSLTALVPSPTYVLRLITLTPADLLPPSIGEAVADVGISEGVVAHPEDGVGMGFEIAASDVREDDEEFEAEASAADTREIAVDPWLLVIVLSPLEEYDPKASGRLVNRAVEEVLAAHEVTRAANALKAENQSLNGSDGHNRNGSNGNGENGNDGNGNPNENGRDARPIARECTYQDFMKCQPHNFKGMEGVVGLIRWFEKMETVFHINKCPEKYQVKYATCTLLNSALTWWNSHKRTIGTEAAFSMS